MRKSERQKYTQLLLLSLFSFVIIYNGETDRRDVTHKGFGSGERPDGLLVDALGVTGHHGQGTSLGEHDCFVNELYNARNP
jgi:hypothetical protein